jgi:hypothetical protein
LLTSPWTAVRKGWLEPGWDTWVLDGTGADGFLRVLVPGLAARATVPAIAPTTASVARAPVAV